MEIPTVFLIIPRRKTIDKGLNSIIILLNFNGFLTLCLI